MAVTEKKSLVCDVCWLEFTDPSLVQPHKDTLQGEYSPPRGLVYSEQVGDTTFVYRVRQSHIGPAKRGKHLHDLVFTYEEYLPREEGWIRNDMPPRDLRDSATQSLINGLKNGRLRLLTEEEFAEFESDYSEGGPLVRTDPELDRILAED